MIFIFEDKEIDLLSKLFKVDDYNSFVDTYKIANSSYSYKSSSIVKEYSPFTEITDLDDLFLIVGGLCKNI